MAAAADVIVKGTFTGEKLVVQRSVPIDYPPRASGNSPAPLRDPKLIDQIELGQDYQKHRIIKVTGIELMELI